MVSEVNLSPACVQASQQVAQNPDDYRVHIFMADVLLAEGRNIDAQDSLRRADQARVKQAELALGL